MKLKSFLLATLCVAPLFAAAPAEARLADQKRLSDFTVFDEPCRPAVSPEVSQATGAMIHQALAKGFMEDKTLIEAIFRLKGELRALIGAPGYSAEAYLEKTRQLSNLKAILAERKAQRLVEVLNKLSPAERDAFAKGLFQAPPFMVHHGMMPPPNDRPVPPEMGMHKGPHPTPMGEPGKHHKGKLHHRHHGGFEGAPKGPAPEGFHEGPKGPAPMAPLPPDEDEE